MNRRSFLKRMAIAAAGVAAGASLLSDRITAKPVAIAPRRAMINPAWINAPYEVEFLIHPDLIKAGYYGNPPYPPRGYGFNDHGLIDEVFPFIEV